MSVGVTVKNGDDNTLESLNKDSSTIKKIAKLILKAQHTKGTDQKDKKCNSLPN